MPYLSSRCAALVITAPASGQGKTTLTAVLAWLYRRQGKSVRVFKVGSDFLDPMLLEYASGHPVYQLDLWMVGEAESRRLLAKAAQSAEVILIEGVMGLFDGMPSTADLAATLNIPVLTVIDASAMAQTFSAIAYGLVHYRQDIHVAGVLANRVGSPRHAEMLINALPADIPHIAVMPRQSESFPSRHLGLVQAGELENLNEYLNRLADSLILNPDFVLPELQLTSAAHQPLPKTLAGVKIGIAKDAAFAFIYQANIDCLLEMGAEIVYFSPLTDTTLPDVDSLYLPGGYPELHLKTLSHNAPLITQIQQHIAANKPILAECGGMLFLCQTLTDKDGNQAPMCGVLQAEAKLQKRFTALALQSVTIGTQQIRGNTYHHCSLQTTLEAIAFGSCPNGNAVSEAVYQHQRLTASYIHFYFNSCPELVAQWFHP